MLGEGSNCKKNKLVDSLGVTWKWVELAGTCLKQRCCLNPLRQLTMNKAKGVGNCEWSVVTSRSVLH